MMWQDLVLLVGGVGFAINLIPQLRESYHGISHMSTLTSGLTGATLTVYAVIYALLPTPLWLAAASSALTAGMWGAIWYFDRRPQA